MVNARMVSPRDTDHSAGACSVGSGAAPVTEPKPCPNTHKHWQHGPAEPEHTCPYREDINGDVTTKCECCETCRSECAMDI